MKALNTLFTTICLYFIFTGVIQLLFLLLCGIIVILYSFYDDFVINLYAKDKELMRSWNGIKYKDLLERKESAIEHSRFLKKQLYPKNVLFVTKTEQYKKNLVYIKELEDVIEFRNKRRPMDYTVSLSLIFIFILYLFF